MKTLAIRQPWITYIAEGTKTVEVRTWRTHYRGPLLLAASGRPYRHADEEGQLHALPTRLLVCVVDLLDVRPMTPADEPMAHVPYHSGLFAWVMANPRHVIPMLHKGRLNIYNTDDDLAVMLPDGAHYLDHLSLTRP